MAKKKPIVSPLGQWAYPGEVTIIPSSNITMKGVNYPVLGVDDLGNSQMMMPGQDYNFPGDYVTEIPQMGKGGLRQWFAEEWTDVKTGKPCGRSGDEKGSRPYPACRPKKRVNETTPKTTSEMSSAEKAKFKREKTSGKRIDYNHKRREDGGETWLDQYQDGGPFLEDIKDPIVIPTPIPQTQKTSFWDLMSYQKDPNNPDNYIKVNKNPNYYKFNTKLNNEGSPEIQAYQNYLNENFNTFIKEDGVWNDETKKAYEKYVVSSQNSEDLNKNKSIKLNTKQPLEFRYKNGALQVKATNPKYNPDLEDWTDLKKLNPTLEEFKAIIDNVPSYNKYYENIYDVNNTIRGVQAGPLDKERQSEISAAKRYQELDPKYKEYLGKTFGNLPIVEKEGIYEGYSPSRIWTTPPGSNSKPWLGDDEVYNPNTDLRYLYFVKPKEGSVWADEKYKEELENLNCINGNCGDEYLNKGNSAFSAPTLNLSKKKTEKVLPFPTGDTWKLGQQSYAEIISNPEILKYAKEKGIDLTDLGKDQYSPILAEAIIGRRDAEFNNKGVVIPHSREYVPVIQDPNQFDLAGYLPITLDMFSPNMNPDAKNQALLNWDEKSKAEYFRRAGIPEDQWDKVYIHTSPFPINNYTPGKKYGGWLEEYQVGGRPIYTSNPNDPRLKSYNDSNTLYNSYLANLERLKKIGQPIQTNDATIKSNYTVQKDNTIRKTDTKRMIRRWNESSEGKISSLENPVVPKISSLEDLNYDPIQQKYQTKSFPGRNVKNIPGKILEDNMYNQYVRQWYLTQGPDKISTMQVSPDTDEVIKRNLKEPQANLFAHMDATHKYIKPIGIDKVYLDPVIQENYKGLIEYRKNGTIDSSGNIVSDSGWNLVNNDINFETKTLNNNPLFIRRYAKPFQPYIYKKPEVIPEVVETPVVPVPVVEPPKPSLFVSNIDRDMYTPGGGMAREYNIGVTLQDGNRKLFRTEKEFQDWKAANNLDISKAKVTEGRGYSYDYYPENKKYGGWLDQFQTGGWAGWTPNVGKPYMRTSPAGNAGYTDNTRVVNQNTNVSAANRKAAEAAEYAKRVGNISQGRTKSAYEKAREASSFVEQEKQRTGSAGPLSYVLDMVNPAAIGFAGVDLINNLGSATSNTVQGNFAEAGSDLLGAGLNALGVIPAAAAFKGIVKPLSKFARLTPGQYKIAQQFANNPLNKTGKYLTTQTPLKNTYKYNPWAFKADPEKYYRQFGKPGFKNALEEGKIYGLGQKDFMKNYPEYDYLNAYNTAIDAKKSGIFYLNKPAPAPFVKKGDLFFPINRRSTGTGYKLTKFSDAEYLAEGSLPEEAVLPKFQQQYLPSMEASSNVGVIRPEFSNLDNFKLYKRDWLRGYKPIDVPNAQSSMNLSKMDGSYLVRELLGEAIKGNQNRKAIAEGNAWLKNWIDDPITQTKIDTDLGWIPQRSNILKDNFSLGYEQAKSFTPVSKEYPFLEQLNDYFLRRPHIHSGNSGVSYLHTRDPYLRLLSEQFNNPRLKASWISRNPSISKPVRRSTTVHEGTHDWTSDFLLRESGQMGDIRNLYSDDIRNLSDQWKSLRNSGINPSEVMGRENATLGYLADPTEVHARIMELRQLMKMTPEQSVMVTPEKAADIITKVQNPKNAKFVDPRFLDVIDKDPKKLATLFNRLWAVPAVATASQLLEQKNGGWLDTYQDGGENLPELNSKIDIANFYKNPLSEKYGIYQDPTDNTYKYYSKSAEEPNIPLKTFDFTNLGNIARRIDKKEITTPQPIKYNSKMIDYAADQDYLTALATEEFPIIPPSFKDVLSNIPKLEIINTIPKPKALPNKQPAVNNAFTFDSNYWNSADVQTEVFNRQLKDNKWYGEFDKRGDNVLNRTDVKRNYDSEVFLQNLATPNSVVIDIGSALGNNNPKLAGVSVYELASNPKIKSKNIKVIATDIPSEVKGFEELKRRGNSVYPIDYAQVPETFNTPVRDILKAKNLENVKDVYLRAANSIDLLMNVQETSEHFKHISSTLKDKNVTYLYNNTILYKPAGSTKFKKLGNLNNSAFDHRSPSWKNNPNRNHYTLLPTNKTGGETGWLNKYK